MERQLERCILAAAAAAVIFLAAGCESLNSAAMDATVESTELSFSRAQVLAELAEAQRLGLIPAGEGDIPEMTAEQVRLIALAGEKASASAKVAQR